MTERDIAIIKSDTEFGAPPSVPWYEQYQSPSQNPYQRQNDNPSPAVANLPTVSWDPMGDTQKATPSMASPETRLKDNLFPKDADDHLGFNMGGDLAVAGFEASNLASLFSPGRALLAYGGVAAATVGLFEAQRHPNLVTTGDKIMLGGIGATGLGTVAESVARTTFFSFRVG